MNAKINRTKWDILGECLHPMYVLSVDLVKLPRSGYTACACRDCFDVAISRDVREWDLCLPCEDAGCDATGESECDRDDAYGNGRECEGHESLNGDSMGEAVYCDGTCT